MGSRRDTAVVLRTMRYCEADRIVTLLTLDGGKVRAVVKGVRRTKSRFGTKLDPFEHVGVQLWEGRGELQTVTQADLVESFAGIARDYDAYVCAQTMCEMVDATTPDHEPNERMAALLLAGLRSLAARVDDGRGAPHVLRPAFLLKVLGVSGFGPGLRHCVHCGGDEGLQAFSLPAGGVVCGACRAPGDASVDREGVLLLQHLWRTPLDALEPTGTGEIDGLVQRAVEYHLERRLRTLAARTA